MKLILLLMILTISYFPCKSAIAQKENIDIKSQEKKLDLIPVGINLGEKNVIESTLIRGFEDGEKVINFAQWLIPFDAIIQALGLQVLTLENGDIELRNVGLVVRIKPEDLTTDDELGLVISIQQIREKLGVNATFDFNTYAIQLDAQWLSFKDKKKVDEPVPIITEGLPFISAPKLTFTTIGKQLNYSHINNTTNINENLRGNVSLVGTLYGGSWYLSTNQTNINNNPFGQLREAQYLQQTPQADYVFGSHSTFWDDNGFGEYWGFTTIRRFGYTPYKRRITGGFNARNRLQSDSVLQDITGKAKSGTLVQLTRGLIKPMGDRYRVSEKMVGKLT